MRGDSFGYFVAGGVVGGALAWWWQARNLSQKDKQIERLNHALEVARYEPPMEPGLMLQGTAAARFLRGA